MKIYRLFYSLLLSIPLISAEEECGLLNLASCLPQKIFEFFTNLLNAPIQPLLEFTKSLLTEPVQMSLFSPLWAIMIYVISLFYGLLILYSGFNFIISGYDVVKRTKAKEWLRNTIIMIVLVQASYFLYSAVMDMGSFLTAGVINLVDPNFFLLTADNITNLGLQFLFVGLYVFTLLFTVVFLAIRYVIVAVGIVLAPVGIFLYFIPPLKDYGKVIFNFLGICIFITFFDALIFLVCGEIMTLPLFENFKILVMIAGFGLSNLLMLYLMFFSVIKSAFNVGKNLGIIAIAKAVI